MAHETPEEKVVSLASNPERRLATEAPVNDWQALGTALEGMTKAGLALTIGFSVAAAFCRLVDSGKIKVPDLLGTLARTSLTAETREKPERTPPGEPR